MRTTNSWVQNLMLAGAVLSGAGCVADVASSGPKADEADAPIDGKADGWNAAELGPLAFDDDGSEDEVFATVSATGETSRVRQAVSWT